MDTTFEDRSVTEKTHYTLVVFYLIKEDDRLFKKISQS